jgi:hypothetical protein
MSDSDPSSVVDAVDRAHDAFEERGGGVPNYEENIESGGGWETQLTKACRLIPCPRR